MKITLKHPWQARTFQVVNSTEEATALEAQGWTVVEQVTVRAKKGKKDG